MGPLPDCSLRMDCEPCVNAFHRGIKWATTDNRKHARVHQFMFEAWGDLEPEAVVWMPVHTSESSVGGGHVQQLDQTGRAGPSGHRRPTPWRRMLSRSTGC